MAEEKNSTVHSKHEIQYITDDRTGHLKLDPFNRDVKREERSCLLYTSPSPRDA